MVLDFEDVCACLRVLVHLWDFICVVWFFVGNQVPTLCIGFENGRVQIMRSDSDDRPVLIDTQLRCTALKWDPQGQVLAVAGMQAQTQGLGGDREAGIVQFYASSGQHLRTLRVPGNSLRSTVFSEIELCSPKQFPIAFVLLCTFCSM